MTSGVGDILKCRVDFSGASGQCRLIRYGSKISCWGVKFFKNISTALLVVVGLAEFSCDSPGEEPARHRVNTMASDNSLYMDNVIPVGTDLFVCGGLYSRQIIVDLVTRKARKLPLRKPSPEIYNAVFVNLSVFAFDANTGSTSGSRVTGPIS